MKKEETNNYCQTSPSTFDDYMKCSKEELIKMLLECHRIIETLQPESSAYNLGVQDYHSSNAGKEIDINTPFFGNSGAKVPMIEIGDTVSLDQIVEDKYPISTGAAANEKVQAQRQAFKDGYLFGIEAEKLREQWSQQPETVSAEEILVKYFPFVILDHDEWAIHVCKAMREYLKAQETEQPETASVEEGLKAELMLGLKYVVLGEYEDGKSCYLGDEEWQIDQAAERAMQVFRKHSLKLKAQEGQGIDTKINLCESCINHITTCKGGPKFGNGKGNDNVIQCLEYSKLQSEGQKPSEEETDSYDWKGEYLCAVDEIKSLQSQLKDAEDEINQLNNELRNQ